MTLFLDVILFPCYPDQFHITQLLSPVPFFTSDPFPIPPIILISYSDPVILLIFLSPLFCFHSSLLILFCPTLRFPHAPISCVDLTSCLFNCSSASPPIPVLALPRISEHLLYINLLYLSIQTNLIISFTSYYHV